MSSTGGARHIREIRGGDSLPLRLPLVSIDTPPLFLRNGGAEFLAEHDNVFWPLGLHLEYHQTYYSEGPLVWRGTFSDHAVLQSVHVNIDAHTGEPVE